MRAISITIDSKVPLRVSIINKRKDTHHKYQFTHVIWWSLSLDLIPYFKPIFVDFQNEAVGLCVNYFINKDVKWTFMISSLNCLIQVESVRLRQWRPCYGSLNVYTFFYSPGRLMIPWISVIFVFLDVLWHLHWLDINPFGRTEKWFMMRSMLNLIAYRILGFLSYWGGGLLARTLENTVRIIWLIQNLVQLIIGIQLWNVENFR